MRYLKWLRPSPALVVALIAVIFAWSGAANSAPQGGAASGHHARFTVRQAYNPGEDRNTARCESEEVATGGGAATTGDGILVASHPTQSGHPRHPDGWFAGARPSAVFVWVICERP